MKHTIEVEVPAGYKPVAFRTPAKGELHIVDGKVVRAIMDFERSSWMIVEKLTPPEFTREQLSTSLIASQVGAIPQTATSGKVFGLWPKQNSPLGT